MVSLVSASEQEGSTQTCTWEASEVVDGPEVREGGAGWQEVTQAAGMSRLFVRSPD